MLAQVLLVEADKQSRETVSRQLNELTYVGKHVNVDVSYTKLSVGTALASA